MAYACEYEVQLEMTLTRNRLTINYLHGTADRHVPTAATRRIGGNLETVQSESSNYR